MERLRRRKTDKSVTGEHCQRFGAIAVRRGIVSIDDVKAAVNDQIDDDINGREHRLLGTILFEKGLITEYQIDIILGELSKTIK